MGRRSSFSSSGARTYSVPVTAVNSKVTRGWFVGDQRVVKVRVDTLGGHGVKKRAIGSAS